MLEDLADSRYLLSAYATSSDSWVNFRRTGQPASLYEVAAILCGAWNALSEDDIFFAELEALTSEKMDEHLRAAVLDNPGQDDRFFAPLGSEGSIRPSPRRMDPSELREYRETDKLLAREMVVLVQAGMEPTHAVRLITDLQNFVEPRIEPLELTIYPSGESLRDGSKELAVALCNAERTLRGANYDVDSETRSGHAPHRSWVRNLDTVGTALEATAGAAGAVGNIAAAVASFGVATGFGVASVLACGTVMTRALSKFFWRRKSPDS